MKGYKNTRISLLGVGIALLTTGCACQHGWRACPSCPHSRARHITTRCAGQHLCRHSSITEAVAVVRPTKGHHSHGFVHFSKVADGVRITADIEGLPPDSKHAFHIHQFGDARAPDGTSTGGHYNPEKMLHGRPTDAKRHAGDLGNLTSDRTGRAHYERVDHHISIAGWKNPILGRAVIIHAGEDKWVQPTGGAGKRIGIGVIAIAKPKDK